MFIPNNPLTITSVANSINNDLARKFVYYYRVTQHEIFAFFAKIAMPFKNTVSKVFHVLDGTGVSTFHHLNSGCDTLSLLHQTEKSLGLLIERLSHAAVYLLLN